MNEKEDKIFCIDCGKRIDVKAKLTGKRRILGSEYLTGYRCFKCNSIKLGAKDDRDR